MLIIPIATQFFTLFFKKLKKKYQKTTKTKKYVLDVFVSLAMFFFYAFSC